MKINTAKFVISNTNINKCPVPIMPEYAFIGRSNVGKSSLINMLTNNSKLAKISTKPGKTQLINHFLINKKWYIVDLPGYGYAKVSKEQRKKWSKFTEKYLIKRENLMCLFVLIDSRIEAQKIDIDFLKKLSENLIPISIIFTKTDKLSKLKLERNIFNYKLKLFDLYEFLPDSFISSAITRKGKPEILNFIDKLNIIFYSRYGRLSTYNKRFKD